MIWPLSVSLLSFCLSAISICMSFAVIRLLKEAPKIVLDLSSIPDLRDMREKVDRFSAIDESVVRSVMEEGANSSIESILRTTKRLVDMGVSSNIAITQAREMHGQK